MGGNFATLRPKSKDLPEFGGNIFSENIGRMVGKVDWTVFHQIQPDRQSKHGGQRYLLLQGSSEQIDQICAVHKLSNTYSRYDGTVGAW